jgi:hypothetical protein
VQQVLTKKNIPVITQPLYCPDLTPSDLAVPYSENGQQGTCFATMEDVKLNVISKLQEILKEAFQQWQDQWSKCVCAQGSYFEGD